MHQSYLPTKGRLRLPEGTRAMVLAGNGAAVLEIWESQTTAVLRCKLDEWFLVDNLQ